MEAIIHNPFRLLGVLSNCSERKIQKNKAKLKAYLDVGKQAKLDSEFQCLGEIDRTEEKVNSAVSALEINKNKLLHSLFWFLDVNHLDEPAFNHLREGNVSKALQIWSKATGSSQINAKNYSSYNNLGTLKIITSVNNGSVNTTSLYEGISHKIELIESDALFEFAKGVTDETYKPNSVNIAERFVDKVVDQLTVYQRDSSDFNSKSLMALFSDGNQKVQEVVRNKFTKEPLHEIESNIESYKKARRNNPDKGYKLGKDLYSDSIKSLHELKKFMDTGNVKYQVIADKLANEVMQCGIDFFQEKQNDSGINPGKKGQELVKIAETIAVGKQAKQRVEENKKGLTEWIERKPQREKEQKVKKELDIIFDALDAFQTKSISIKNAWSFAKKCRPELQTIKHHLGSNDDLYMNISNTVVNNSMAMAVQKVNRIQENFETRAMYNREEAVQEIREVFKEAYNLMKYLEKFDMNSDLRSRYRENKNTISDLKGQVSGGSGFADFISGILKWGFYGLIFFFITQTCN
ncbi:MAG: hypothetical protein ACQETL_18820 [Bacteroidota bacterium]